MDYVYLVMVMSAEGLGVTVFDTRANAEEYATRLRKEENKDPWLATKAVRSKQWIDIVFS